MRVLNIAFLTVAVSIPSVATAEWPPCSCLQELLFEIPGPDDLYIALTKLDDCSEVGEEELWWGHPSNTSLPQVCENGNCEAYQGGDRRAALPLPGHGEELVGAKAWDVFRVGLESAARKMPGLEFGIPLYHKIPRNRLPASVVINGDMLVMAIPFTVHAKGSRIDGRVYYLCVQIDSAGGLPLTTAAFEKGKAGTGSQMRIDYRVNGEARKGLVWLK